MDLPHKNGLFWAKVKSEINPLQKNKLPEKHSLLFQAAFSLQKYQTSINLSSCLFGRTVYLQLQC